MTKKETIKYLKDIKDTFLYFPEHLMALDAAIEALKQPKQKKGKWVKQTELSESICSNCKKAPKTQFGCLPNYCPNCGAKMEE